MNDLRKDIEIAINAHSAEDESDTPDFILAKYLTASLAAFDDAVIKRDLWYAKDKKAEVVEDEQSDIPESDISDIVSVQPLVSDTGKIFYMESTCNHALQIRSDTVTVDTEGGDAIVWRDVLDMLSCRIPLLVIGTRLYPASEAVPSLRNQVALNSRRGRANFMIVNRLGFDWLRTGLIPLVPSEPRWTKKCPSFVGEYAGMKVYYDNRISAQIIGYHGTDALDSGVVVARYDKYHHVKLVNPSYYIRFNV